jgi:aryl-alcohol dehydrogenase-like predicted oxidoreductase
MPGRAGTPKNSWQRPEGVRTVELRTLGRSGLQVSALALGTMGFGGAGGFSAAGSTDVQGARRLVDMALDAGVNLIDTADIYSHGLSEEILGEALSGRRDEVVLATKVHGATGTGANEAGLSRRHIVAGCEASLRRLGTDYIDVYQAHAWDGLTPLEETLSAFDDLVRQGKVRYVGCSNYAGWQLMKALGVSEARGLERFSSQQIYYSLLAREAEYELVPIAQDQGVGIVVWSPLAGGFLSGKYGREDPAPEGSRRAEWGDPGQFDEDRAYAVIDALREIAAAHEASVPQAALRWLLHQPGVASVIVGARTPEQLEDNLGAARWSMTEDELAALDELTRPPLIYPYWHQERDNADRPGPFDRWPRRMPGA